MRRLFLGSLLAASLIAVPAALAVPPNELMPNKQIGTKRAWQASNSNLAYHGGPVVRDDRTYTIYWTPRGYSMSAGYSNLIDGFFANVAAANSSGSQANTYFSDTQYSDAVGPVGFGGSSFGGSTVDRHAFPASGCDDGVAQTTVCLTDAQLQAEIASVVAQKRWPQDGRSMYFLMTPRNVGSCDDATGAVCAFSYYCAYHCGFDTSKGTILYTNEPYPGTDLRGCGSGQSPNGDVDADSAINTLSHEHNETITDPLGTAWWDNKGYENADKCAWTFGAALGGAPGAQYNQQIGTGRYYLQRNWSNASSGCVLTGL